jgi:hypothetical protein
MLSSEIYYECYCAIIMYSTHNLFTLKLFFCFFNFYILCSINRGVTNLALEPTRVEAGSNTSTVTLRVVRGDEMGLKRPRHSLSG